MKWINEIKKIKGQENIFIYIYMHKLALKKLVTLSTCEISQKADNISCMWEGSWEAGGQMWPEEFSLYTLPYFKNFEIYEYIFMRK